MSKPHPLMSVRQIAVTVSDVDRALEFYQSILGLALLFRGGPEMAFLDAGTVRIMLTTPQGAGAIGANSVLYFQVSDIQATHQAFLGKGATNERAPQIAAKMPDHELWLSFLRDTDGNLVGLLEETPL